MSTEKLDLIKQNRHALAEKFEAYIRDYSPEGDASILGTISKHAGVVGVSRWGTLSSALKELLKRYKAEDLFYPAQLDPDFLASEPDRSKKYSREPVGTEDGKTQTVYFSFAPGAKTPIHNHWAICVSYSLKGEGIESTFKSYGKDEDGAVQIQLINKSKRVEGSTALDLQTGDDFTHQLENKTGNVITTVHFYGTGILKNPNKYKYTEVSSGAGCASSGAAAGAGAGVGTVLTNSVSSFGYPKEVIAKIIPEKKDAESSFRERYRESARTAEFARR